MSIVGSIKTHVARKTHCCAYCDGHIEPGERYESWAWRESRDEIYFNKNHIFCKEFYENHCVDKENLYHYEITSDGFWDGIGEWRRAVEEDLGLPIHYLDEDYVEGKRCFCYWCDDKAGHPTWGQR